MRNLTPAERKMRAVAILAEANSTGCGTIEATHRINAAMFGEASRRRAQVTESTGRPAKAATPKKGARRQARLVAAVRENLAEIAAAKLAPAPRLLHEMRESELAETTAAAFRSTGGVSPYWKQPAAATAVNESAPPGVPQGPAGTAVPTVNVLPIPAADPVGPLHQMASDDWERVSASWFIAAAQQGHRSPFWQAS